MFVVAVVITSVIVVIVVVMAAIIGVLFAAPVAVVVVVVLQRHRCPPHRLPHCLCCRSFKTFNHQDHAGHHLNCYIVVAVVVIILVIIVVFEMSGHPICESIPSPPATATALPSHLPPFHLALPLLFFSPTFKPP